MTDAAVTPKSPERAALEAVLEALDIPPAATMGDEETRAAILAQRTLHAVVMLKGILRDGADTGWCVTYLRDRLAEHPATGYRTWDALAAELAAARVRRAGR